MLDPFVDSCYDIPDERDYKHSEVFKEEMVGEILPNKCILDNVEYQNQWLETITKMMCVFYSTWHWSNEENFQEWSDVRIICKDFWLQAEKLWRLDITKGAMISDWPRTARDLWYIKGWSLIETVEEAKSSIYNKRPIVVWSNRIKWSLWYNKPFVLWGDKWSAHAIVIIWYDDNYEGGCFVIKQSYWDDRYYEGKQYLKYEDFWLLFPSKFSLIDSEDPILIYKKKIMEWINIPMAKIAFELWLWNWKNSTSSVSREEDVTIALRLAQKILNWEITKELLAQKFKEYWIEN